MIEVSRSCLWAFGQPIPSGRIEPSTQTMHSARFARLALHAPFAPAHATRPRLCRFAPRHCSGLTVPRHRATLPSSSPSSLTALSQSTVADSTTAGRLHPTVAVAFTASVRHVARCTENTCSKRCSRCFRCML
jgi:hypothetical protein